MINRATDDKDKCIKDWLSDNKLEFEKMVLANAWAGSRDQKRIFINTLCKTVDVFTGNETWVDDFSKPLFLPVYRAICDFAEFYRNATEDRKNSITNEQLRLFLSSYASNGEHIAETEIETAIYLLDSCKGYATEENFNFVNSSAFDVWVVIQKKNRCIRASSRSGDYGKLVEELNVIDRTLVDKNKQEYHAFGEGIDKLEPVTTRLSTRFIPIDVATGGGLGLGEATLVIAPPGSGKTILTCQLGSRMALAGSKVLIISTEETHRQLEPRIVSSNCSVDYGSIKDGVDAAKMTPKQKEMYQKLRAGLTPDVFRLVNWDDRNKDYEGGFEALMDGAAKQMGGLPEIVFLDWLGGALGRNDSNDPKVYRNILKRGACAQASLAKRFNIHTITCAQANESQCHNKVRVDSSVLSENKTLHEDMTNAWGLTTLTSKQEEDERIYQPNQFIYVSKARRGLDKKIPVHRDFSYQRYNPGSAT